MINLFLHKTLIKKVLAGFIFITGWVSVNAQFLLQAPTDSDQTNFKWYEATDTSTILGTQSFLEVTQPGIYFATYDGTLCGNNATGYFILTNCDSPQNQVTLDIAPNVNAGATVSWSPALSGDPLRPVVLATEEVEEYVATVTKAGNDFPLPKFTVVCMGQSAELVEDTFTTDEDLAAVIDLYNNDSQLPSEGVVSTTNPANGVVTIDDSGTPNDPSDDIFTYTPNADFNGTDSFEYTVCNSVGQCSTASVTIEVLPIVDAINDSVAVGLNEQATISFIDNDNDFAADNTLTFTNPANGQVVINNGGTPNDITDDVFLYLPNDGFLGTDTFDYTLCDSNGNCSTATISVIVSLESNLDSDNDGILNAFEDLNQDGDNNPATNPTDTDGDTIPDYLDIDSDGDGIPDNVEGQSEDYIAPSGVDANDNGVDDAYEQNGNIGIIPIDTDGDGLPDYVDTDSDNDGVEDIIEAHDFNGDGIADITPINSDKDNDGLDDNFEGEDQLDADVNDELDIPSDYLPDTDGDGIPNYRDTDDDGDTFLTADEDLNNNGNWADDDADADGIPDYLDPDKAPEQIDELEVFNVITPNGDGVHDVLKINNIEDYPNNHVRIFNRWGVIVYQAKGYNNRTVVFDGTSTGRATIGADSKLPVGTYFYIIDFETPRGSNEQITGYLYINN